MRVCSAEVQSWHICQQCSTHHDPAAVSPPTSHPYKHQLKNRKAQMPKPQPTCAVLLPIAPSAACLLPPHCWGHGTWPHTAHCTAPVGIIDTASKRDMSAKKATWRRWVGQGDLAYHTAQCTAPVGGIRDMASTKECRQGKHKLVRVLRSAMHKSCSCKQEAHNILSVCGSTKTLVLRCLQTYLQRRLSPCDALHCCCVAALGPRPQAHPTPRRPDHQPPGAHS